MISETDKARVSEAIRAAEAKTSGEIFCIVAHRSSDYRYVPIAWAAALALIVPMPLIYFTYWDVEIIYLMQLVTFIVAAIVLLASAEAANRKIGKQTGDDDGRAARLAAIEIRNRIGAADFDHKWGEAGQGGDPGGILRAVLVAHGVLGHAGERPCHD